MLAHGFISEINLAIVKGRWLAMTFPIPESCKGFSVEKGKTLYIYTYMYIYIHLYLLGKVFYIAMVKYGQI